MQVSLKTFDDLTKIELYKILQLRAEVFVVEQECPYQDVDDLDQMSHHLLLTDEYQVLKAYCRIIPAPYKFEEYVCISRVVSHPSVRKEGWGKALMLQAITHCHNLYPALDIKISAQLYLKAFYESFGFEQVSDMYLEDNIPHIAMIKKVNF